MGFPRDFGFEPRLGRDKVQSVRVMELGKFTLFDVVKRRLAWIGQRQEVLAQNIANADTPKYRAQDIEPFKFKDLVRSKSSSGLNMDTTAGSHLPGRRSPVNDFKEVKDRRPFETNPVGNSVVLEEQMSKLSENGISHRLTTQLYKKHLNLFRMALRGSR